jgi:hypothetical protein
MDDSNNTTNITLDEAGEDILNSTVYQAKRWRPQRARGRSFVVFFHPIPDLAHKRSGVTP